MTEWLSVAQFISSTALTAMSVTVAIVVAVFGYRNLNGWKPVLLTSGVRMAELKKPGVLVGTSFEVWNRRQYAIYVRGIEVDFGKFKLKEFVHVTTGEPLDDQWFVLDGKARRDADFFIEPNGHCKYDVDVKFEPEGRFEEWPEPQATIKVAFYDVKRNKRVVLSEVVRNRRTIHFLR